MLFAPFEKEEFRFLILSIVVSRSFVGKDNDASSKPIVCQMLLARLRTGLGSPVPS